MCSDQGYNYTILSNKSQALTLKWYFNKTDFSSLNFSDYSLPSFLERELKRHPKCADNIRKAFCLQYLPPCLPGEQNQYYGLCKNECRLIYDNCPEFFGRDHPEDIDFCEDFAEGESNIYGLCAYRSWPRYTPFYFRK